MFRIALTCNTVLVSLVYCVAITSPCQASIVLGFTSDGSASNFEVPLGETLEIPIYLRQLNEDASHPNFVSVHGLNIFGVAGNLQGAGVSFDDSSMIFFGNYVDQLIFNPSFSTPSTFVINGFDPRPGSPGTTGEVIPLGSIRVRGDVAGSVATLSLGDPDLILDDFATSPNFGSFDAAVFSNAPRATVKVVPEANSLLLAFIAASSAATFRRRILRPKYV